MELTASTVLHVPLLTALSEKDWTVFVDAERPNWCSVDARGAFEGEAKA